MSYFAARGYKRGRTESNYFPRSAKTRLITRARRGGLGRRVGPGGGGRSRRYGRNFMLKNIRTGGLLGIENKYLDHYFNAALVAPTNAVGGNCPPIGGALTYTAPAQGDGPTNRDGNKIVVNSITVKGVVSCAAQNTQTTADVAPSIFIALVQDTQTNAAVMVSQNVFDNPSGQAAAAAQPFRNMSHMSRFKILAIKKFTLQMTPMGYLSAANFCQAGKHYNVEMYWKGKMPVTFLTGGTTDDVANVTDNNVSIIAFCSDTSLVPTLVGNVRIRFYG